MPTPVPPETTAACGRPRRRLAARWLPALALLAAAANGAWGGAAASEEALPGKIPARIVSAQAEKRLVCRGELVCGIAELPRFYSRRGYRPAWHAAGRPTAAAAELLEAIRAAEEHGLRPGDYHLAAITRLLAETSGAEASGAPEDLERTADQDLLLTDAFLLLSAHLFSGRVNPETLHAEWSPAVDASLDLGGRLEAALASGRIREALNELAPPHPDYAALKESLKRYRAFAAQGGWEALPEKTAWKPGEGGAVAERLQARLRLSGDLPGPIDGGAEPPDDAALAAALRGFQARHGLEAHGRLDAPTLAALNVPADERARQIEINLERWRWLPRELGRRHLWVNVPDYTLEVVEDGQRALSMRVVVGRHYRRTPVFSGLMEYLVFNPDWNIPGRIAVQDILPKIRKDPGYIGREKIRVYESWSAGAPEIDPSEVDWSQVTAQNFRFKLRKDPGPKNDLGRIKFMFPNRYSVYLHDTPSRALFARGARGFSSGCIRIEKPIELAEYVLRGAPGWDRPAIEAAVRSGGRRAVNLPEKIPVHLAYLTAWVDREGVTHFRPDIYGRDPVLEKALSAQPPRP